MTLIDWVLLAGLVLGIVIWGFVVWQEMRNESRQW